MAEPRAKRVDQEVEEFRRLMEVPSSFADGFSWTALAGALFVSLIMVPGALYMGLLAGGDMNSAASWVTVILFIEVAKRTQRSLSKSEIFVLFFMASAAMGAPFSGLLWNQFYAHSDAAIAYGIANDLPTWWAPAADSVSYAQRTFFHRDWLPVIALVVFQTLVGQYAHVVLGYGLFRVASDIEKLPFPMAPIGAQGILALAEDADVKAAEKRETSWRWRVFSIGGALGMGFGTIYLLIPTISAALTGTAIQILPIPFVDWTPKTGQFLPAVATGLSFDLGNLVVGMVLPFWAMIGSFIGLVCTFIMNPLLFRWDMLTSWKPGDSTVVTLFMNNVDFYFSFNIGIALSIFIAGVYQVVQGLRARRGERAAATAAGSAPVPAARGTPSGRGDMPTWLIISSYFLVVSSYILVCGYLIEWHRGVMIVLVVLGFVITPLISYVTARMEGIAGQVVEIPMVKEISLIVSGYRGVAVWFLPIPIANYGAMTVFYRQAELLGTRFTSIWKAQFFLYPIILVSSILFANFIWGLADIPSGVYPYTQAMWPLQAANNSITISSTQGEYSIFETAFKPELVAIGAGVGTVLFGIFGALGAPIFLTYGVIRGLGHSMPHAIVVQLIGALLGRFYFRKKFGPDNWRKAIPIVCAGFFCGQGLVAMLGIGITFLSKAVVQIPF